MRTPCSGAIVEREMAGEQGYRVTLDLEDGFRFAVGFDDPDLPPLLMDEPPPLGEGAGPSAGPVHAAAVANCLSASALHCLRRARIDVQGMHTTVDVAFERDERGRLRVQGMEVQIEPVVAEEQHARMRRCLELFEDYCVVTQSVRRGIAVDVAVRPVAAGGAHGSVT
jgi:uncharacterized OsmC-like protein